MQVTVFPCSSSLNIWFNVNTENEKLEEMTNFPHNVSTLSHWKSSNYYVMKIIKPNETTITTWNIRT